MKGKNLLLILDDYANSKKFIPTLEKISCIGRHFKCSAIVTTQNYKLLSSIIRNNTKCWLLGKMNRKEVEKVVEELSAMVDEEELRNKYYSITSEPYAFLHLNEYRPHKLLSRNFDP